MASTAEVNAAFDAIEADIRRLIELFIPSFFQGQAMAKLNSPEGRQLIVDGAKKALIAAEKVRAREQKAAPP